MCLVLHLPQVTSAHHTRRCRNLAGATEAGLRLQRCSGCDTARYCSEACHRAAWRAGHKGACRGACKRAPDRRAGTDAPC